MPICKNCNSEFPNRVYIDSKQKDLSNRSNCLTCSPFDSNEKSRYEVTNAICAICGRKYLYTKNCGHTKTKCNSCVVNSNRIERKQKALDYLGGKCYICGYNKCQRALEFHHVDPTNKSFSLSGNHCLSWERVKAELDKCVLLCCRCHVEVEANITKLVPLSGYDPESIRYKQIALPLS